MAAIVAMVNSCSGGGEIVPRTRGVATEPEEVDVGWESTAPEPRPPVTVAELSDAGTHWRLVTPRGPVHVWIPRGYDAKRAETIVYVHGYYVHVDDAWEQYDLQSQFASSAIDAMFIAPEGPASFDENVAWPDLKPLLEEVGKGIGQSWPKRRIVAIGHSAAYRTLLGWLDEPEIDTVVLVDAAYGEVDKYKAWVDASDKHRLIDVGDNTRTFTDQLHAELPETVTLDEFPSVEAGIPREAANARVLYIKSDLGHFPLVTNGYSLPMLLRTLRAKRLVKVPLAEILETR